MTKTLETKRKILQLLKRKEMTISELSSQLDLSTATVSQHINELIESGAIEKVDNQYFKKLKYYKLKGTTSPVTSAYVKYVVGAVVVLALLSGIYFYSLNQGRTGHQDVVTTISAVSNSTANTTIPQSNVTTAPIGGGGALACPMIFYSIDGSIVNASGMNVYTLNYSNSTIADYVIGQGHSGVLHATEFVYDVLPEPANSSILYRQHYSLLQSENQTNNFTVEGVNVSISPQNFTVVNNETLSLDINVTVNSTTPNSTYWLRIDGPCDGGVTPVLLTIGNHPYNGTVHAPMSIFA